MTPSRLLSDGKGSIGAHATYNGRAARAAQRLPCMTRRSMRASCVASATEPPDSDAALALLPGSEDSGSHARARWWGS